MAELGVDTGNSNIVPDLEQMQRKIVGKVNSAGQAFNRQAAPQASASASADPSAAMSLMMALIGLPGLDQVFTFIQFVKSNVSSKNLKSKFVSTDFLTGKKTVRQADEANNKAKKDTPSQPGYNRSNANNKRKTDTDLAGDISNTGQSLKDPSLKGLKIKTSKVSEMVGWLKDKLVEVMKEEQQSTNVTHVLLKAERDNRPPPQMSPSAV